MDTYYFVDYLYIMHYFLLRLLKRVTVIAVAENKNVSRVFDGKRYLNRLRVFYVPLRLFILAV